MKLRQCLANLGKVIALEPASRHRPYAHTNSPKTAICPENAYYPNMMAKSTLCYTESKAFFPRALCSILVRPLWLLENKVGCPQVSNSYSFASGFACRSPVVLLNLSTLSATAHHHVF